MRKNQWMMVAALSTALFCMGNKAQSQQTETAQTQVAAPETASQEVQGDIDTLLGAISNNSYADFVSVGDAPFKAALTKDLFAKVVAQYSSRLASGYDVKFLGDMNKNGFSVSLWRIRFKAGGDDVLAEMSTKDGLVGGFFLR